MLGRGRRKVRVFQPKTWRSYRAWFPGVIRVSGRTLPDWPNRRKQEKKIRLMRKRWIQDERRYLRRWGHRVPQGFSERTTPTVRPCAVRYSLLPGEFRPLKTMRRIRFHPVVHGYLFGKPGKKLRVMYARQRRPNPFRTKDAGKITSQWRRRLLVGCGTKAIHESKSR